MMEDETLKVPETLPLLPVRDMVMYPAVTLPLFLGREMSINAVEKALSKDRLILVAAQKDLTDEDPLPARIYSMGVVSQIMRMLRLPDGRIKILIQGIKKARIEEYVQERPTFLVRVKAVEEPLITEITLETEALMRYIKEEMEKVVSMGRMVPSDVLLVLDTIDEPGKFADIACANLGLQVDKAQELLEIVDPIQRLRKLSEIVGKEIELLNMQAKILSQAKDEMTKSQREYFLREQMKAIRSELGETDERDDEVKDLRKKIKKARMPREVEKEAKKQVERLEMMHPDAIESSMLRTYIEWLVELPWSNSTKDNIDIRNVKAILDEDHYDLEKVKERILEFLSVIQLKGEMKGPILCFVGPPGVGKTSLGRSIARSLGRTFHRLSLGGMKDEAEIRGHRRTYVGAMPGRIIQGLKQGGTNNPVFMLDEVDKIGMDFRGDPASALLEVLDPEQNVAFSDHYLNLPFDLSKVMFITTANQVDTIPAALHDRMETINIPGYTEREKLLIAKRHLLPKQVRENGLTTDQIAFTDKAIEKIISEYTREAGLRNLEREIAAVARKVARKIAEGVRQEGPCNAEKPPSHAGPAEVPARQYAARGHDGCGVRPRVDRGGRRHSFHRGVGEKGQEGSHPHGQPGERDEGVGPGGLKLHQGEERVPRDRRLDLRQPRAAHSCAPRGDTERRTVRGHNHGRSDGKRPHQEPGGQEDRHDGGDHPHRQSPRNWRLEGEDARRPPGRDRQDHHSRGQRQRAGGDARLCEEEDQVPPGQGHGRRGQNSLPGSAEDQCSEEEGQKGGAP